MSKWSIFLNNEQYCYSEQGSGNRPCDYGVPCDKCHYDSQLQTKFREEEANIVESDYCSCCGHKLKTHEKGNNQCEVCDEYDLVF